MPLSGPSIISRPIYGAQVVSAAWDPSRANLFTGDETGRLRCWNLKQVLRGLGAQPVQQLEEKTSGIEMGEATSGGGPVRSQV